MRFDLAAFISYTLFIFLVMKKSLILIYLLVLLFTLLTSCVFLSFNGYSFMCPLLMVFAVFKFLLVAFQFMELKKAHMFWKISLIMTLGLLVILIIVIK